MENEQLIKGRSVSKVVEERNGPLTPNDKFEINFGFIAGFGLGLAIVAMKADCKVARAGWNGKGMWLKLMNGVFNDMGSNDFGDVIFFSDSLPKEMYIKPWIGMKCADGEFVPWLASQTDMLAEDWQLVE